MEKLRTIRIVIPAYKNLDQLRKCKEAIASLELPDNVLTELTVINNTDNNIGFTKAVNIGLRDAIQNDDEYAILLNQDCYLKPDFINNMLYYMDSHPEVAIAGPMQVSDNDPDLVIHAGCTEAYPYGKHISGRVSNGECLKSGLVSWVNGACMIARMSQVMDFGLLDESMFLVGSDSDWCFRARHHGFDVAYVAECKCVHEQGVTSGDSDERVKRIMYLDMIQWRNKWVGSDVFRELSLEIFE